MEELWLSENQLTGQVPESLGDLSSLKVLTLWSNQLTGMIPASLVRLTSLEKLYLSQNQFTGCIPSALQIVQDNDISDITLPFCVSRTVTLSNAAAGIPVRINSAIPVTATFSEPVSGFTVSDITVTNGAVSNFGGGDFVFTFDVIPSAIGVVTVDVSKAWQQTPKAMATPQPSSCPLGIPYDDDGNGAISLDEAITAVRDYFSGILSLDHAIATIRLYFSSPG